MAYLYETHLHTKQSSACGVSYGREYISKYIDLGYSGIIVTDHFYRGYSAVSRSGSWEKWVTGLCRGYEDAREEGARRGLDVFFGWEETFAGDDYLVYGLSKEWLLDHPEAMRWNRKQQFEEVRAAGGCVVQAHPFRQAEYISCIYLSGGVDAVEAANPKNTCQLEDACAYAYAKKLGLPITAGSDTHWSGDVEEGSLVGVYLDKKIESISEYVAAIRAGNFQSGNNGSNVDDNNACNIAALKVPKSRFELQPGERLRLPVDIRDSRDKRINLSFKEFLAQPQNKNLFEAAL